MKLIEFREEEYDRILEKARSAKMTVKEIKEFLYELFMALCEYDKDEYSDEEDYEDEYEDEEGEESDVNFRSSSNMRRGMRGGMRGSMRRAMRRGLRRNRIGRYTY